MSDQKRGRKPIAASVAQLPASAVPTEVYDEVCRRALRRGVSVASVIREILISHLKNTPKAQVSAQ